MHLFMSLDYSKTLQEHTQHIYGTTTTLSSSCVDPTKKLKELSYA